MFKEINLRNHSSLHKLFYSLKLPVPSQALPFFICIPFGFIIGILIKRLGSYPLTIEEVLMSVKQELRYVFLMERKME